MSCHSLVEGVPSIYGLDHVRVIGLKRGVIGFISLVRCPRATHEGNKSHNHELKGDKRLIFTLARISQGMQKCFDEKCLYCSFFFCFLTLHAGTGGIPAQVSRLFNYVSFLKSHFE